MRYEKEGAALKKYAIDLDITKCISCGACSVACMDQNEFPGKRGPETFQECIWPGNGTKRKCKIQSFVFSVYALQRCTVHQRMPKCLPEKRPRNESYSLWYHQLYWLPQLRDGMSLWYSFFGENGKMIKCDGCYVRVHHGMLPACVKACPVKALQLVDTEAKEPQIPPEHSLRMTSAGMLKQQV